MDIQKTVLVVDDSTTNRSILCDILHSDYTVIQAENGIQKAFVPILQARLY